MKKRLCFLICIILIVSIIPANATELITVTLNGKAISFDQPPTIQNDRVLVPMRAVFEALGADVYWSVEQQIVGIIKNDIKIIAQIGQKTMTKFVGKTFDEFLEESKRDRDEWRKIESIHSDVAPQIINGRTYIPLRVISETLGVFVDWDGSTNTAILECDEVFISQQNEDKVFMDEFLSGIIYGKPIIYDYTEVEDSPYVPEGIKELCREISSMTDAVEICKIILDKYGDPAKNYLDSPMFIMPVWEVEGGELSLVVFQGVRYTSEYSIWNLMPVYSKFSEVLRPRLDINLSRGEREGPFEVGYTELSDDGTYQFVSSVSLDENYGAYHGYDTHNYDVTYYNDRVRDFIENSFFSKNPSGTWEIEFQKDYGYEMDIRVTGINEHIATLHFTGDNGESAHIYIKSVYDSIIFDVSDELNCSISSHRIRLPFDIDSIYFFI